MAVTAVITLSNYAGVSNQTQTVTCTVTNTGAAAVNVVTIRPMKYSTPDSGTTISANSTLPVSLGMPPVQQGQNVTVPASGTLAIAWDMVPFMSGLNMQGEASAFPYFYLGCVIRYTDGTSFTELTPTPVRFWCQSQPNAAVLYAKCDFTNPENSYLLACESLVA